MRFLARLATRHPWIVIALTLAVTLFFAWQLRKIRIDNEVKDFLPDAQEDKQNYLRMEESFRGEIVAFIGVSVDPDGPYKDVFAPKVLQTVQDLTDWLKTVQIEDVREHWIWVKEQDAPPEPSYRKRDAGWCTPEMLKEISETPTPENLDGMVKIWKCKETTSSKLDEVVSLATMKVIYDKTLPPASPAEAPGHELIVDDLWKTVPQTQSEADESRKRIESWSMYKGNVVSEDLKSTLIVIFIPAGVKISYEEKLQKVLDAHIAEIDKAGDGLSFDVGGLPMVNVWLGRYLTGDLTLLIPFVFLVIIAVLIISFRRSMGVVLPSLNVALATIWTVGLIAFLGKPLTLITSAMPTLIVAVGSAYAIHVIHHYFENRREGMEHADSVRVTLIRVGMAVVMAGLTTIGGFLSLTTTTVVPIRDFGLFAAFGTFASLFIALTFIPSVIAVRRPPRIGKNGEAPVGDSAEIGENPSLLTRGLLRLSNATIAHRWGILVGTAVLLAVCGALASHTRVTSNVVSYFPDGSPIRTSDDYLNEHFGGTNVFSMVFDGGRDDYWKDPENLRKLEKFLDFVKGRFPEIGTTLSALDYIKKMNMALESDDPAQYRIPETRQAVADCLFLLGQKSDALASALDFEYRRTRVAFKCTDGETGFLYGMKGVIDDWIKTNWPEMHQARDVKTSIVQKAAVLFGFLPPSSFTVSSKYYFSGMYYFRMVVDQMIVISQVRSLMFSLIVVFILATIIFRSLAGGLLSVGPTIIAVGINFAIMVMTKIPLDIGTALISAAAIGCGIDYAIHYLNRFLIERANGYNIVQSIRRTHLTTSKAIVFNATSVAFGFFVMFFSNFQPIKRMGMLTGVAMFTASGAALIVIPTLVMILQPKFVRRTGKKGMTAGREIISLEALEEIRAAEPEEITKFGGAA